MKSYEALQKAIAGRTVEHAKRLGLASVTVNKWQEPHTDYTESGAYNPLDRTEVICDTAMQLGIKRKDALAPVHWLNHRFGLVCFDMPSVPEGGVVAKELLTTIKEFSDLVQVTSEALLNNRISRDDARKIIKEGEEALRAIGALMGAVEAMAA